MDVNSCGDHNPFQVFLYYIIHSSKGSASTKPRMLGLLAYTARRHISGVRNLSLFTHYQYDV